LKKLGDELMEEAKVVVERFDGSTNAS